MTAFSHLFWRLTSGSIRSINFREDFLNVPYFHLSLITLSLVDECDEQDLCTSWAEHPRHRRFHRLLGSSSLSPMCPIRKCWRIDSQAWVMVRILWDIITIHVQLFKYCSFVLPPPNHNLILVVVLKWKLKNVCWAIFGWLLWTFQRPWSIIRLMFNTSHFSRCYLVVSSYSVGDQKYQWSFRQLMNNRVFFQHPDLMRLLCVHENVMTIMMNILTAQQGAEHDGEEGQAAETKVSWTLFQFYAVANSNCLL